MISNLHQNMQSCEEKYGEFNGAILIGVKWTILKSQFSFRAKIESCDMRSFPNGTQWYQSIILVYIVGG